MGVHLGVDWDERVWGWVGWDGWGGVDGRNGWAKSGLVGMKGYLETYNPMKYFFAVLKPFLTETAFYTKLAGRFSGSKTEVM